MTTVEEGSTAPDFTLMDADGKPVFLKDLRGRYVVLYFYPKADTPGCTKEALAFTEMQTEFHNLNASILGVSPDSVKAQGKFRDKHSLGVVLLADEEKSAIQAYGAWGEKKMYGKAYMGVDRSTFLIGPDGKVLKAWRGVKVPGHAQAVLDALKEHAGA
jgi:peroxiredoxin Q/BCP